MDLMLTLAIRFSDSITLGSIVATAFIVIVAGLFTIRANTAKIWRENFEGERERCEQKDELLRERTDKMQQQEELIGQLQVTIKELESLPNFTEMAKIMLEGFNQQNLAREQVAQRQVEETRSLIEGSQREGSERYAHLEEQHAQLLSLGQEQLAIARELLTALRHLNGKETT